MSNQRGVLWAIFGLLALTPAVTRAQDAETWVERVVHDAVDSVVLITVEGRDGRQAGLGSGFVVAADGLVATNLHVIGEARPITVRFRNGREYAVTEIYATDRQLDLAVIRIAADGLKPIPVADETTPITQGQPIVALGNPMGLRHSVVSGVVSGTRDVDDRQMIQIAMPIEPGNSGGPLLDRNGQVIGLVTLKSAVTANLGFAVPASALKTVLAAPNPIAMERWKTIGLLSPEDWSMRFGARWQQRSGEIHVSESGDGFGGRALCLWKGVLPNSPYELGTFVKLEDEAGAAGLVFHADGADRHYGFYPSAGRLRLTRFDGPTVYQWQVLEEISSEFYRPGKWNHLKVRLEGDEVACFVNDQLVLKRKLPDASSGQVGLAKFRDTHARFRQFRAAPQLDATRFATSRLDAIYQRLSGVELHEGASEELVESLVADADASAQAIEDRAEQLRRQADELDRLARDVHVRETCLRLAAIFQQEETSISLAEAALWVSRLDNADLDVAAYRGQLERMAAEVEAALPETASDAERLDALNRYLFTENGYHGSRTQYYQAANSYLDRVVDDREGLPITLSVLYLELANRLRLKMEGVGLPGHFVVRHFPAEGASQLIDVFDAGRKLDTDDARRIAQEAGGVEWNDDHLAAVDKRTMVLRMLRNLQGIAQRQRDLEALLGYTEAMVCLDPANPVHRGARALLRFETDRRQAAVADLDWLLETRPSGIDLDAIEQLKQRFLK